MKKVSGNAGKKIFLVCLAASLVAAIVSAEEPVIGTAQTSFVVGGWDATFNKDAISMNRLVEANKKIEDAVVTGYKSIETAVVSGYKAFEDRVVGSYKKIENKFVDAFLTDDGQSQSGK
jgi:hypothetical protein